MVSVNIFPIKFLNEVHPSIFPPCAILRNNSLMLALMHSPSSLICQILLCQVPLPNNHHIIAMTTHNHGYRAGHPIS